MSATMEPPATKQCAKCGIFKASNEFHQSKSRSDGLYSSCKACVNERAARWKAENPDRIKEYSVRYYAENRDKLKESKVRRYAENPGRLKEYSARYYAENLDKFKGYSVRHRAENRDKFREYSARYRARQKAMREFFKMHRAMHAIAETLNQMKP